MRTKNAVPRLRAKRRLLKRVKGSVGGRRRLLRTAKESIIRAGVFAKRDVVAGSETFDASGLSELMQRVVNVVCVTVNLFRGLRKLVVN